MPQWRDEPRAQDIARALRGRWNGRQGQASCPVPDHGRGRGDRNPSLTLSDGDNGAVLVHCHAGCTPDAVIAELKARGLWPERERSPQPRPARKRGQRSQAKRRPAAVDTGAKTTTNDETVATDDHRIWPKAFDEAQGLLGTPVQTYLERHRGVAMPWSFDNDPGWTSPLRFHPSAPFSKDGRWRVPGLMAIVQDASGRPIGCQVTALRPDGMGKHNHPKARHNFGCIHSGAVRLTPMQGGELTGALAIAEGIETALGFTQLTGYPCWAALGGNLAKFICPPGVDELVIAADHDEQGMRAAQALARKERANRFVEIRRPTTPGEDWADVAKGFCHAA